MAGFVWLKTIKGARTAGLFAFQANDGKLYAHDGTSMDPPSGSVMISGEELITTISKSTLKGLYVCEWTKTRAAWNTHINGAWNEYLGAYSVVDSAIKKITDLAGLDRRAVSSPRTVAEKKAAAKEKKEAIEREFGDSILTALHRLKPTTVRTLVAHPA
tara:strand:+ start:598 stop:1074 length:477 start_codon:yes stop_codon:yes gene_type:complete